MGLMPIYGREHLDRAAGLIGRGLSWPRYSQCGVGGGLCETAIRGIGNINLIP